MGRPDVAALFDRVAATYDAVGVPWFGPVAEGLVQALAPSSGERVVDVGCGRGAVTRLVADAVGPSGRVHAFDLAPGMVRRTAEDLDHLPQVVVAVGDAREPRLEPGDWDVVASSLVLFFLPDPGEVVRRWVELLAPAGRLGVSTLGAQDARWEQIDDLFTPYLPADLVDARTSYRRGPFGSDEGVEVLLREAGLREVATARRTVTARFRDVEHWERWSRSHGQRALWDAVPGDARHEVLRGARAAFADGELALSQEVRYTVGRR